ncbi:MAG: photosynthetic complex putative assembly protein PuhB [bacterium]
MSNSRDAYNGHEHELEPQFGLPEPLPASERILWQASPQWRGVALRVFHVRKLAVYFALILALRGVLLVSDGAAVGDALIDLLWLAPVPLFALAMLASLAWMTSRTTVYTLTDKRLVMRIGIVLTLTFNLPLRTLRNADLRLDRDGSGDIAVLLPASDHIGYLNLWPNARPWRMRHPEPMLRSVPDAAAVAGLLVQAWSAATGAAATGSAATTAPVAIQAAAAAPRRTPAPQVGTAGALPAH